MAGRGNVFIVRGDISRCQADALVFSTATHLSRGHLFSSFASWPGFADWMSALKKERFRRLGDTDWLRSPGKSVPGIVLVRTVGEHTELSAGEVTAFVLENALVRARQCLAESSTKEPWLILVPALLTGQGGGENERHEIAGSAVRAAAKFVEQHPDVDVAFVMYTPTDYALYRQVRREQKLVVESAVLAAATELTCSVRTGECIVFVGAGVSQAAGLPGWDELVARLAANAGLDAPVVTDYAKKLEVAETYRRTWKERGLPSLPSVAHAIFGGEVAPVLTHYLLAQLDARFVVTTNYDRLIEKTLAAVRHPYRRVTSAHDVPATSLHGVTQVLKLHGDAAPPEEAVTSDAYGDIVLSTTDYESFTSRRAAFDLLLSSLMLNHTFLFVGYSVSDENVRNAWRRILEAINQHPDETTRSRKAYGLEFQKEPVKMSGVEWLQDPARGTGDVVASTRAQWQLLDALAEYVEEPVQLLAPDAREDATLAEIRPMLVNVGVTLTKLLSSKKELSAAETRTIAQVGELLYELGWRTNRGSEFLDKLAKAAKDRPEEVSLYESLARAHHPTAADDKK